MQFTTDTTIGGQERADNSLLDKLTDDAFAHQWLCHSDGAPCPDGCDTPANPARLKFYQS